MASPLILSFLLCICGCSNSFTPLRGKVILPRVITSRCKASKQPDSLEGIQDNNFHSANTSALLSGSTRAAVWTLSGPAIGIGLLRSLYGLTDALWIGRLGPVYLEALGSTSFATWMMLIIGEVDN